MNKVKAFPITPFETYLEMTQYGTEVHFEHDKYELLSGVYEDGKMYFLIDYHTGLTYEVEQKIAENLLDLYAEDKGDELVKEITPRLHSSSSLSYS
ncbi:hypothetical protein [Guptibacillus hwajinpoensis]|uniref:Uncharacterized protein n=1 Tax=Guptibacillus hwajinpoensis TaxID=208199 RepID=A0ABU0JYK4_9BACL|nr:hypothetical protein [Alkalihalobacillus hemicentroti]MDQ0482161.1 hypothetical protein [Alkalihalobacillus hemicentroti]